MTLQLTHIRLLVSDFKACFLFYRDALGFESAWGDEAEDYAEFEAGAVKLALFKRQLMAEAVGTANKPSSVDCQDKLALIFAVNNVDEVHQHLKKQGISFENDPFDRSDWGIRAAHFRDPDGNLIEINSNLQ